MGEDLQVHGTGVHIQAAAESGCRRERS